MMNRRKMRCMNTEKYNRYLIIEKEMEQLKKDFKKIALQDEKLKEYFKDKNVSYDSIRVAGVILGGIDIRNFNSKDNQKEKYPYSEEQLKMIDKYHELDTEKDELEWQEEIEEEL